VSKVLSRRGSALLIVLGMLAFMMVSAVGFAIYMRQSRVPSSQFRRTANARQLLKAALANAIARIDGCLGYHVDDPDTKLVEGIYDDVYPGIGPSLDDTGSNNDRNGDFWSHRVFMPFGPVGYEETVATLTFEALAYLPPALVNEVRAFSRMTQTAVWRNLSFDSGRYAFCAVDVSDLFDINKVRADSRRTSLSGARISMASLFPDTKKAELLGKLLAKGDNLEGGFLSLADYNVVAGSGSPFAPFCKYVRSSGAAIYSRYEEEDVACVSNALFITDTWFPPTNIVGNAVGNAKPYNLESGQDRDQPWADYSYESLQDMLDGTANKNTVGDPLFAALQGVGLACLYDYLDGDSIPLSYCLPCTETAPMICGIGLNSNPDIKVELVETDKLTGHYGTADQQTGNYPSEVEAVKYALKVTVNGVEVNGLMAFPFKRVGAKSETYKPSYNGAAMAKLFFGTETMMSRLTRNDTTQSLAPQVGKKWEQGATGWKDGVCTMVADHLTGELKYGNVTRQTEALHEFDAKPVGPEGAHVMPFFWVVTKYDTSAGSRGAVQASWFSLDGIQGENDRFRPRDEKGELLTVWENKLSAATATMPQPDATAGWPSLPSNAGDVGKPLLDVKIVPHLAVWMRLDDGEEPVSVDVVPATPADDELYGDRPAVTASFWTDATGDGEMLPLLEFRGAEPFELELDALTQRFPADKGGTLEFGQWNRLYAVDPRFNFAPENWFAMKDGNGLKGAEWLDMIGADGGGGFMGADDKRDTDIFMFTSDQEFLQSVGELAFLPRVCEINKGGNGVNGWYTRNTDDIFDVNKANNDLAKRLASSKDDVVKITFAHGEMMWRTYTAVPHTKNGYTDPIYAIRDSAGNTVEIVAGEGDFRVNPYSRDPRILDAVVRETPFDYYAANVGPNNMYKETKDQKKKNARDVKLATPAAADKYVFGPKSTAAAMTEKELTRVTYGLRTGMETAGRSGGSWISVLNSLEWYEDDDQAVGDDQIGFLGQDLSNPLHGVDRKFLYSYWRECFQNRQQLFLVFIRAEPLTVGGMGVGSLASTQLGARGVALVWRDPEPPAKNAADRKARSVLTSDFTWNEMFKKVGPHRTRILFYHQFD